MISREGRLRTFQTPGSSDSLRAARSKRAAWACQGLVSSSREMVWVGTGASRVAVDIGITVLFVCFECAYE